MYEISLQTYIPTLILKCEPKSGLSCRRQVVHPRPQTPQGESVAKPETPLLIILSIACKWGPWQHVQSIIRKAKKRGQKHPREVVKNRNSIPNIKVNTLQAKIVNIRYRTTSAREGQATTGHPFPHQQTHNYMLRPISRIQTHSYIYIYTRTNCHKCPSQTRGRQEETHCPSHRFRCLFLYLL